MQASHTFQLEMKRGPRPGQTFELPRSTISIGRDSGNQVVVNDPQISRQHARITPQGGLMILEDLGSTNGTVVNGLRITGPHALAHGDEIDLGDNVTLIFYGRPASGAGETVVAPRATYAAPEPAVSPRAYQPSSPPAYEAAADSAYPSPAPDYVPATAPDYAQAAAPDYEDYAEYYEEYPEETGRNWALIGMGCLLVAIIIALFGALWLYFSAPASVVDPIADFLYALGIDVCAIVRCG